MGCGLWVVGHNLVTDFAMCNFLLLSLATKGKKGGERGGEGGAGVGGGPGRCFFFFSFRANRGGGEGGRAGKGAVGREGFFFFFRPGFHTWALEWPSTTGTH